jgi:hypothetical protein
MGLGVIRYIDEVVFTLFERETGTQFNPDDESQWIIVKPLPVSEFPSSQDVKLPAQDRGLSPTI